MSSSFVIALLTAPFLLQGGLMLIDEFHYHKERSLEAWERYGHPLDSGTLLACFLWLSFAPETLSARISFLLLAVFSCLFITKDEFVHAEKCKAGEHWLHAVLFILHPVVLGAAACIRWMSEFAHLRPMLWAQSALIFAYLLYQLIYWNVLYEKTRAGQ